MKVLLTAFGGKLQSKPMDFPENTSPEINMIMDFDLKPTFTEEDWKPTPKGTHKVGVFSLTSRPVYIGSVECREYKLIDVLKS